MTTETAIWMVDWQSESDLDSIRNSCDVYYTQTGNISVLIFKYVYFLIPCFPELIPTRLVHSQNHWSDPSWWVVKDPAPRRAFITFHSHCSFLVTIWSAVLDLTSQFFPLRNHQCSEDSQWHLLIPTLGDDWSKFCRVRRIFLMEHSRHLRERRQPMYWFKIK